MMAITPEQARAELARRELAKRGQVADEFDYSEFDKEPERDSFPVRTLKDIVIGTGNLQRRLFNTPHDIAQGLEGQIDRFNQSLPSPKSAPNLFDLMRQGSGGKLSDYLPHQPEFDYSKFFGQKGAPSLFDSLIQKGIEYAPEVAGGGLLLKEGLRLAPLTQKMAARQLKKAEKLVKKRGVNLGEIDPALVEQSLPFLPKTHATREMIKGAQEGGYESGFGMQSQVGKHERDLRKSSLAAERLLAPEARDLKKAILEDMQTKLKDAGHHDIAEMLKGGLNDYRKYIKIRDEVYPVLRKLGVPASGAALLKLVYEAGKKGLAD